MKDLYRWLKNITIWIRNHGGILFQFEEKLKAQFSDKRKSPFVLRLLSVLRMSP